MAARTNLNQQDYNKVDMIKKWLAKLFKKKGEQPLPEEEPKNYMGYTVVDGETGMMLSVLMVCGCGNPVIDMVDPEAEGPGIFYCEHCDRPCTDRPCGACEAHFMFDAEAVKSEAENFRYDEEEDE